MKKLLLLTVPLFAAAAVLLAPLQSRAMPVPAPAQVVAADCRGGVAGFLGLRSWDACLPLNSAGDPTITNLQDIWLVALVLVEDAMKIAAYVAVGFIIWGGIKYVKSQGEPGETTQARQIIYNAVFGLIIVIISIAIVTFVGGAF